MKKTYESLGELKEENKLEIYKDNNCDMAKLLLNGKIILEGNFWDFHNGCYGMYDIPDFNSINELKNIIVNRIESQNLKVEIIIGEYEYE